MSDVSLLQAMWRGFTMRCPCCGKGKLFGKYSKVVDACAVCGEEFHHHRADDAPPYIVIVIVGHIIVPLALIVEQTWQPAQWLHFAIWMPAIVILSLLLIPPVKGAVVAIQWYNGMHGFRTRA